MSQSSRVPVFSLQTPHWTLILFLSAVFVCGAQEPKPAIQSAEQAVLRFREARETDLKTSLSEPDLKFMARLTSATSLVVRKMQPRDYTLPYRDPLILDEGKSRILGTLAAAAAVKNDTWRLYYGSDIAASLVVYLDALTGKVLYIHSIPEG